MILFLQPTTIKIGWNPSKLQLTLYISSGSTQTPNHFPAPESNHDSDSNLNTILELKLLLLQNEATILDLEKK